MKKTDTYLHLRGEAQFVDDLPVPAGLLHAAVCPSAFAHGRITEIDIDAALHLIGVVDVFTAGDVPGQNQIGNVIADEPLLADGEVHYVGQPVALVVAETPEIARRASRAIVVKIEEWPAVFDPREACQRGDLIIPPRIFSLGDITGAWPACETIVEGRVESGGQEHVYMETQSALVVPFDHGGLKVYSATQAPTAVQRAIARALGLPMHQIEVEVPRLGGAFGGKEDQATAWAVLCALAAERLKKPAKLVLRRPEDMRYTGKRHPYSSDFKIGLAADGKILAYEVEFYQNAGASADLSTAILDRTLFHTTNSYYIPNVLATGYCCRTNLVPNTAFRGFGGPQAMFVLECALHKAAQQMGVEVNVLQKKNLLKKGDEFPFGMRNRSDNAIQCWSRLHRMHQVEKIRRSVDDFNRISRWEKKGLALMPICFGISFTNTLLNQASALVHVYSDGSVGISTAAVEMGQGVNQKLRLLAADVFGIGIERIKIEATNTTRNANTSPTAASTGSDLNGHATLIACQAILTRLKKTAAFHFNVEPQKISIRKETLYKHNRKTGWNWQELVSRAYSSRTDLSAHAHYATPRIHFDQVSNKGDAFAYHVYGTALVEATVDGLRGTYRFDSVKIVHDAGQPLDLLIDRGQMEGGVVQGLGWMTLEEVLFDARGRLMTDNLTTYKVPDIHFAPGEIAVEFFKYGESSSPGKKEITGPLRSKAMGEPPFMYGIGGYFALLDAIRSLRPEVKIDYVAPLTPERALRMLQESSNPDD